MIQDISQEENNKKSRYRIKKYKKSLLFAVAAVILAVACFMNFLSEPVYAYTTSSYSKDQAFADGYFYLTIVDSVATSKVKITFSRDRTPDYSALIAGNSRTWNVSLTPESEGNNHNISLASSTMTSVLNQENDKGNRHATIGVLNIRYTQHKYNTFSNHAYDGPANGRFCPYTVASDGNLGTYTVPSGVVDSDTAREITISFYLGECGLITQNKKRYQGVNLQLNYYRPSYTVKFYDANNNVMSNQTVSRGDAAKDPGSPSKTGYNFSKWDTDFSCVKSDLNIKPVWSAYQHIVKYDLNGGTGTSTSQTKTYGQDLTLHGAPSKTGYTFVQWNGDSGVGSYAAGASYKRDFNGGEVTMTAQWSANTWYVKYNPNNGSGSMADSSFTYDSDSYLRANTFTRAGYAFNGWNTRADGKGTSYSDKANVKNIATSGTVNLYAQWKVQNYTISYKPNGGTGTMSDQTAQRDMDVSLKAVGFARPGYTFVGWSADSEAVTASYKNGSTVNNLANANATATLYAVWKKTDASFDTDAVIHDDQMFTGDGNIAGESGTTYDKNHVDSGYAKVDENTDPGYFTRRN